MITSLMQLEFDNLLNEIKPATEPKEEQLRLEIEEENRIWIQSCLVGSHIWNPSPSIVFNDANGEVGRFSWRDGVFKFEGNAETSAKLFANHIAKYCGLKIKA